MPSLKRTSTTASSGENYSPNPQEEASQEGDSSYNNDGDNNSRRKKLKRADSDAAFSMLELNGSVNGANFTPPALQPSNQLNLSQYSKPPVMIKGAWSAEEDRTMLEAVNVLGMDWKKVSSMVNGRSAKQCRDRYRLKLDPAINHGPWTNEEDESLLALHNKLGRQWTKISRLLPGRTENAVKSRYSSLFRSRTKEWSTGEEELLKNLHSQGVPFEKIAKCHLPHRSEHAVKKRWEKMLMKQIALQIKQKLPVKQTLNTSTGANKNSSVDKNANPASTVTGSLPKLNPALAASTMSSVARIDEEAAIQGVSEPGGVVPGALNRIGSKQSLVNLNLNVGMDQLNNLLSMNSFNTMNNMNYNPALNYRYLNGSNLDIGNLNSLQVNMNLLNAEANAGLSLSRKPSAGNCLSMLPSPNLGVSHSSLLSESSESLESKKIEPTKTVNFESGTAEGTSMETKAGVEGGSKPSNRSVQAVKGRSGRLKRHSTSTTVMMQLIGEPLQ